MLDKVFTELPPGSVRPAGILLTYCKAQAAHITRDMELYDDFSASSAWLGGSGERWERGPYYVRGLVNLAFVTGDEELKKRASKWIRAVLSSGTPSGDFGPNKDIWCKMPVLYALRDYFEGERREGRTHGEILEFLQKYFDFELKYLRARHLRSWAKARAADNAEIVAWYVEKLKASGASADRTARYERLVKLLLRRGYDWEKKMRQGDKLRAHVVNTTQGFKQPYIKYLVTGDKRCLSSLYKGLDAIRNDHGRIDGLPNADEAARDNLPTRGTETCAVVEGIASLCAAGAVSGDARIYDILESYAYNNLPNCFDYDMSTYCYFQLSNQVLATHGTHGFANDHGDSSAYGIGAFECCFANCHYGFPKFIENMWSKRGGALVLTAYGACEVDTEINGKRIGWREETLYPYRDAVRLVCTGDSYTGELLLRVPSSVEDFTVDGIRVPVNDGFVSVRREFKKGCVIDISFVTRTELVKWHDGGAYVRKGAAIYCLPVKEDWRITEDFSMRGVKYPAKGSARNYEVYPASEWRYTLESDEFVYVDNAGFDEEKAVSPKNYPAYIEARLAEVVNQKTVDNVAEWLGNRAVKGKSLKGILVPTAASRLKISVFSLSRSEGNLTAITGEDADLRDKSAVIAKILSAVGRIPSFVSEVYTGYSVAELSYPVVKGATYAVIYGVNGEYTEAVSGIRNNPYIFGGDDYGRRINRNKYAVNIVNGVVYCARVAIMINGNVKAVSEETTFVYRDRDE